MIENTADTAEEIVQIFKQDDQPVKKLVKIMGLMTGQYYTAKPIKFFDHLSTLNWSLMTATCYQTLSLDYENTKSPDSYLAQQLARYPESQVIYGLPLYVEKSEDQIKVYYCYLVHSNYINLLKRQAFAEYEKTSQGTKYFNFKIIEHGGEAVGHCFIQPSRGLFPTVDFNNIKTIVADYINTSKILKQYNPLVLRISGETGSGKTCLAAFLSSYQIFSHIYKIDMTSNLNIYFRELFNQTVDRIIIQGPTLIVFDDLDIFLAQYIFNGYQHLREHIKNYSCTFEEYNLRERQTFLSLLLSKIERENRDHPLVFMFCSTNFDFLDSNIKIRSISVKLSPCDHIEAGHYLRFYNNKYFPTKYYEPDLEYHLQKLTSLTISFRELSNICTQNGNNMIKIINSLINYIKPATDFNQTNIIKLSDIKNKAKIKSKSTTNQTKKNKEIKTKCFIPACPRGTKKLQKYYYCPDHLPLYPCALCNKATTGSGKCFQCYGKHCDYKCPGCGDYTHYDVTVLCPKCEGKYVTCYECREIISEVGKNIDENGKLITYCPQHLTDCKICDGYCTKDRKLAEGGHICYKCFRDSIYCGCDDCFLIFETEEMKILAEDDNRLCLKCYADYINDKIPCLICHKNISKYGSQYCPQCEPDFVCNKCEIGQELNQFGYCNKCSCCPVCYHKLEIDLITMTWICFNCRDFLCPNSYKDNWHTKYTIVKGDRICATCRNPEYIVTNGSIYRLTCQYCGLVDINNNRCPCPQCLKLNSTVELSYNLDVSICCHNCGQLKLNNLEPLQIHQPIYMSAKEIEDTMLSLKQYFKFFACAYDQYTQGLRNYDGGPIFNIFSAEFYQIVNNDRMVYAMLRSSYGFSKFKYIADMFLMGYENRRQNLLKHRTVIAEIWTKMNFYRN